MDTTEYIDRAAAAIARGNGKTHAVDVTGYPEDIAEVVEIVCELWYLIPPATKKSKAYWIQSAHELLDACGEFGVDLIRDYRLEFEGKMREIKQRTGQGCAPHTVEGPGSLVKMVRDLAGRKRAGEDDAERRSARARMRYAEE